jgi:hypothetical protein
MYTQRERNTHSPKRVCEIETNKYNMENREREWGKEREGVRKTESEGERVRKTGSEGDRE